MTLISFGISITFGISVIINKLSFVARMSMAFPGIQQLLDNHHIQIQQ